MSPSSRVRRRYYDGPFLTEDRRIYRVILSHIYIYVYVYFLCSYARPTTGVAIYAAVVPITSKLFPKLSGLRLFRLSLSRIASKCKLWTSWNFEVRHLKFDRFQHLKYTQTNDHRSMCDVFREDFVLEKWAFSMLQIYTINIDNTDKTRQYD